MNTVGRALLQAAPPVRYTRLAAVLGTDQVARTAPLLKMHDHILCEGCEGRSGLRGGFSMSRFILGVTYHAPFMIVHVTKALFLSLNQPHPSLCDGGRRERRTGLLSPLFAVKCNYCNSLHMACLHVTKSIVMQQRIKFLITTKSATAM